MNRWLLSLSGLLIFTFATAGFAQLETAIFDGAGNKLPDKQVNSPEVNWELLTMAEGGGLNGIGLLDIFGGDGGPAGGCTAALLDTGATDDRAPAYVLTNGHCAGPELLGTNEVLVNKAPGDGMNFRLNYFVDAGAATRIVPVRRLVYATMHATDIAILELDATFHSLASDGFVPHAIADKDPEKGTQVEMIGVPQSGVARSKRFVRRSVCEIGGRTALREGGYEFFGAFRHACSSIGGSSGSPMIARGSSLIVAINNTSVNDSALSEPECALNRPCEVDRQGNVTTDVNGNYAQRVSDIPGCFNADGVFDLDLKGCRLERPAQFE